MRQTRLVPPVAVPPLYSFYHWITLQVEAAKSGVASYPFLDWDPISLALTILALITVGGVMTRSLDRDLTTPWIVSLVGLGAIPWLFPLNTLDSMAGPLLGLALLAIGVSVFETWGLRPASIEKPQLREHWIAIVAGLAHVFVGLVFHAFSRGFGSWLDTTLLTILFVVGIVGTLVAGVLPVHFWRKHDLRAPVGVLLCWVAWGVVRGAQYTGELPLTEFAAVRLFVVRPFPDYLLGWPVLVLGLAIVASLESLFQKTTTSDGSGGLDASR